MNLITAPWKGQERLWVVLLYSWALGTILRMALAPLLESGSTASVAAAWLIAAAWGVYIGVSLWRCAFNTGWRPSGYAIRALVLLVPLLLVASEMGWVS